MDMDNMEVFKITQLQLTGIIIMSVIFILLMVLVYCSNNYSLNGIKSKKIGNGQHGTARFSTKSEIKKTYTRVPCHSPEQADDNHK